MGNMEEKINEIINSRYGTDRGYLFFVDLIKEKYPVWLLVLCLMSIPEVELRFDSE